MTIKQDPSHPTGVTSDDKGGSSLKRARDRKANSALDLKVRGYRLEDIAIAVGYPSARAVGIAIERMLEDHLQETDKAVLRQITYRRLENAQRAVYDKAMDPNHPGQIEAIHAFVKIVGQQSKLMGIDSPTEIIVSNPITQEVQAWIDNNIELANLSKGGSVLALEEGDILGDADEVEDEESSGEVYEPMTDEEWEAANAPSTQ